MSPAPSNAPSNNMTQICARGRGIAFAIVAEWAERPQGERVRLLRPMKVAAIALLVFGASLLRSEDPESVGFSVLANFEYKAGMKLPDSVAKYDGKRVVVAGFMKSEDGS